MIIFAVILFLFAACVVVTLAIAINNHEQKVKLDQAGNAVSSERTVRYNNRPSHSEFPLTEFEGPDDTRGPKIEISTAKDRFSRLRGTSLKHAPEKAVTLATARYFQKLHIDLTDPGIAAVGSSLKNDEPPHPVRLPVKRRFKAKPVKKQNVQ